MDGNRVRRAVIFHGLLGATILAGPAVMAGPLAPWNGGSATVEAVGQTSSQQGSHASASAQGTTELYYSSINNSAPNAYHIRAQGAAEARVSGTSNDLLQVDTTYSTGNPGTRPYDFHSDVNTATSAEASWTGDRIHIGPDANGTIPNSIRLGVTLNLANAWSFEPEPTFTLPTGGVLDLQLGNQHIQLSDGKAMWDPSYNRTDISAWLLNQGFASVQKVVNPLDPSGQPLYQARAYLTLPVDANGWTSPFDLSLKYSLGGTPESNTYLRMTPGVDSLSLDDITLADGTNVLDAGHIVTFESGLAWASPVPEPGSFVLAASMALGAIAFRKKLFGA